MPYEYCKLSPKEREEIVRYRSERGYPLHAPPHPFRDAGAYLVSAALKRLHGTTSREWNIEDNLTGKRRVWYKFADTYIRNDVHLHTAFNYIHYNPVKHGYASDPYEWPWSSLTIYYDDKGREWLRGHWQMYTPPVDFGKGWDDFVEND